MQVRSDPIRRGSPDVSVQQRRICVAMTVGMRLCCADTSRGHPPATPHSGQEERYVRRPFSSAWSSGPPPWAGSTGKTPQRTVTPCDDAVTTAARRHSLATKDKASFSVACSIKGVGVRKCPHSPAICTLRPIRWASPSRVLPPAPSSTALSEVVRARYRRKAVPGRVNSGHC